MSDLKVLPNHHGTLLRTILWENFMIEMKNIFKIMYNGVFPHSAACVFPVIGPLCLGWENVLIQKVKILVFLMISYPLGHVTEA